MGFADRLEQTNAVIAALRADLWESPVVSQRLIHVDYGAEHIVPKEVHAIIRFIYTETTRHIKFAPDFFVVDKRCPERTYLLVLDHSDYWGYRR